MQSPCSLSKGGREYMPRKENHSEHGVMFPSVFRNLKLRNSAGVQVYNSYQYVFLLVVCPVIFDCMFIFVQKHRQCHRIMTLTYCHTVSFKLKLVAVLDAAPRIGVTVPEKA